MQRAPVGHLAKSRAKIKHTATNKRKKITIRTKPKANQRQPLWLFVGIYYFFSRRFPYTKSREWAHSETENCRAPPADEGVSGALPSCGCGGWGGRRAVAQVRGQELPPGTAATAAEAARGDSPGMRRAASSGGAVGGGSSGLTAPGKKGEGGRGGGDGWGAVEERKKEKKEKQRGKKKIGKKK